MQRAKREEQTEIMAKFRFEDLEIWQMAIEIADELFDIADTLDKKRLYRFAEQLRGAEKPSRQTRSFMQDDNKLSKDLEIIRSSLCPMRQALCDGESRGHPSTMHCTYPSTIFRSHGAGQTYLGLS